LYAHANIEEENMAKSKTKKKKRIISAGNSSKADKEQTKAAEYVNYLLELHKLQGVLLNKLSEEAQIRREKGKIWLKKKGINDRGSGGDLQRCNQNGPYVV